MLRIYDTVIALLKLLAVVLRRVAEADADLSRQGRRAAASIALNVAEGSGVRGGNRRLRYETALGSALEVVAVLDVAEALGYVAVGEDVRARLSHVIAVLMKCTRR